MMYYFGTILSLSAILMTAALGNAFLMKSGQINLGGEGQIYAGGFIAAIIFNSRIPFFLSLPLGLLMAGTMGTVLTVLSVILQKYKRINYMLSSFLISAAVIPITDALIAGPFRGKNANLLSTDFIDKSIRFKSILPPSTFNGYFFFAVLLCLAGAFVVYRTTTGYQLSIYGKAQQFSIYMGFSDTKFPFITGSLCGFLHGLAGAAAVLGNYYACHTGFYSGLGWNSLSSCMIAFSNPLLIIPSSICVSAVTTGAGYFAFFHNFDFDISGLIQGIVFFMIAVFSTKMRIKQ
ncbi:MAG: ABC transporter permease [Treponema sp.]|nr:ABC transporter permease [Treponema sp.]